MGEIINLNIILLMIGLAVLYVLLTGLAKRPSRRRQHPVPLLRGSKMIYSDHWKNSETFRSTSYKLKARPDAIYRLNDGRYVVVEYKNRFGDIYESDIEQLIANVICARSRYPSIALGVVQTNTHHKMIELDYGNEQLIERIETPLRHARLARQQVKPAINPVATKCKGCGVNHVCEDRV